MLRCANPMECEVDPSFDESYQAMAADHAREIEAQEWCNALAEKLKSFDPAIHGGEVMATGRVGSEVFEDADAESVKSA